MRIVTFAERPDLVGWISYDATIGLRDDGWYLTCARRLQQELDRAVA